MRDQLLRIWLTKRGKSPHWVIRYKFPESRRVCQVSTGTTNKKEAERRLGELRADLLNQRHKPRGNTSWSTFRVRYEDEVLTGLSENTALKVGTVLDAVERLLKPAKIGDLTNERISFLQAKLREEKRKKATEESREESTIAGYLAHLRSALRWACDIGMIAAIPKVPRLNRAKVSQVMKGRPITQEEFERMVEAVPDIVGEEAAVSWRFYLEGLWWSGLRLAESLNLFWDDESKLCVTKQSNELVLRIPAELEKGHKDRLLPIAPEFADFLRRAPTSERTGRVFKLKAQKRRGERLTADRVTRIVSAIGRKANVVVDKKRNKFATAHDLRRSFGERWAPRVMPQVLMELMRHESIETTLRYYVGQNALRTTRVVREAYEKSRENARGQGSAGETRDSLRDSEAKSSKRRSESKSQPD